MIRNDIGTIFRTTTVLTLPYNTPTPTENNVGSYSCHLSKQTGIFVQGSPNAIITTKFKLYLDIAVDIKNGDIVQINSANKYIVENVYKPMNKHIECDLTIKGES